LGELHYGGYTTKKDRDKKIKEAKKALDEYAELYEAGMFLTAEPKPEDYSDTSRYVAHYLAFTIYIPHGYFQMTSERRRDYFFANRTAIQARKELAGSRWNLAQTKKRVAEQQRRSGTQDNKTGKVSETRKQ
jgi:predicted ribonuclease toxin of YeeF-YezG toxin-antitoxin module